MTRRLSSFLFLTFFIYNGANSHGQLGHGVISEQCDLPKSLESTWHGKIKEISCGGGHTLLITEEGKLYACGWNHHRQLGMDGENCTAFTRVWDLSGIAFQKVCSGWDSSAAISEKNIVYLWGSNMYGQLGLPCDEFPKSIRPIQLELKAKDISMGLRHTVLLDVNGNVWTTGNGKRGQLGLGSEIINLDRFQKIECINNIDSIACGQHHTLAWSARNKTLYSWGDNTHGQLGETTDSSKVFNPLKITIFQDFNIVHIYAGWTNSAILLKNGDAIYWGRNNYGQLGIEDIQEKNFNTINFKGKSIVQLALGSEHSICLLDDNTLWAWGWNEHGNTGTGSSIDLKEPKKVNTNNIHISSIAAGAGHNFIINNDI